MAKDDTTATTARVIRTHGTAMREANELVGGSRQMGVAEAEAGAVDVAVVVVASVAAGPVAATLLGGP